jgi:peroxiredoxin
MKLLKLFFGVLAVLALGIFALVLARPEPLAPDTQLTTLAGERLHTADLRGKVTVVNFWSTTCGICLKEMPELVQRHRTFAPRGYETVAVAMPREAPARVRELVERRRLPYKVALDEDAAASEAFGNVRLTPTTFVIDRRGRILKRYVGKTPWAEFDRIVERALEAGESGR